MNNVTGGAGARVVDAAADLLSITPFEKSHNV
jgi:hypothetical protein